ncbi:MAG: pitrilysin family protein [Verrucomicrobiota bacterium]
MPTTADSRPQTISFPSTSARRWTLPNGLVIIVQEDHAAPVASVQAWCETGSITEDKHLGAGLSHILEHMLFKGTATREPNQIAQSVQNAGGYINAYTSFDRTVYWIDIPSKGVATAIDILADTMMNSTLPAEEYIKEQEVIRREFAMSYDDPDRMSSHLLFATAYREHPYQHPVIGHLDVYNQLTREEVMAYYKARYVPNNLFFVVVGDVDAQQVHDQLAAFFEKYPRQPLQPVYIPQEPLQLGRREHHQEFPTELTRMEMAWHIPEVTHPDVPALDLLSMILGDGRSSRLYRRLREDLGLVHEIHAWCYTPGQPGLFGVESVLDPERREATQAEIFAILKELKTSGATPEELAKVKKQTLAGHLGGLTTTRGKASDLGSNWKLTRNLNFTHDYLEAIQRVTAADIARVLHTYFEDRNLVITSLNPPGTVTGAGAQVAEVAAGEIQKFELSNGLRLLVREDSRLPLVSAIACFKAGLLAEAPESNGITRLFSKTVLKGTQTRSAAQIAEEIESLGGGIGAEAGNNSVSVSVKVMQPDLEIGLELLADVLMNPTFPEKAVAREKEVQLASIKAEEEEMTSVARQLLRRTLFAGHPYGMRNNGTPETVAALSREELEEFRKRYVAGRNGVLSVFGDVKAEAVKALAEKIFGALPCGESALENPPQAAPLPGSQQVEEYKEKSQAIVMVGYRGTDLFSPDRHALELIDEACSDLGSRFFIRIREKLGLAYFVGSSQVVGLVPGPFVFYLGTDPAKVEAVKAEFLDEIRTRATEGLTAEELQRAKEKLLGQQDLRNQSNDTFAYACALDELYGLGFDDYKRLRQQIESLTLDEVKAVSRKYFDGTPSVLAVVRPAEKL